MFQCSKLPWLGWRSADFLQGLFCPNCLQEQRKHARSSTNIYMPGIDFVSVSAGFFFGKS
jgi:hypothetical protein